MKGVLAYLKEHAAELALFVVMASALSATMCECFFIETGRAEIVTVQVGAVAALAVLCYAASSSRRAVVIGIPVILVVVVVLYIVLAGMTPTGLFEDSYDNTVFVFHVAIATTLLLFLCTRRRGLLVAAFVIGAVLCSVVQFLYGKNHIAEAVVYLVAGGALVMLNRSTADERGGGRIVATLPGAAAALAVSIVAAALAAGTFFAVVAPLNPPARELKLITERYALEEVHVSGLTDIIHMIDKNTTSSNLDDATATSSNASGDAQNSQGQGTPSPDGDDQNMGAGSSGVVGGTLAKVIKYLFDHWLPILVVSVLALVTIVALTVFVRRWQRRRMFEKLRCQGARDEVMGLYRYISNGFEVCGVCTRGSATPTELAHNAQQVTSVFEQASMPLSFQAVTDLFARVAYGGAEPAERECEELRAYCKAFPAHVRRFAGRFKYLRLFFKV